MSENATKSYVDLSMATHEKDWIKRSRESEERQQVLRHKQWEDFQKVIVKLDSKIDNMKDDIKTNDKELWLHKQSHQQMAGDIKEIKDNIKWHSNTLSNFLEKMDSKFVTKSEYNIVVKIIYWVATLVIVWGGSFIWDKIKNLI